MLESVYVYMRVPFTHMDMSLGMLISILYCRMFPCVIIVHSGPRKAVQQFQAGTLYRCLFFVLFVSLCAWLYIEDKCQFTSTERERETESEM